MSSGLLDSAQSLLANLLSLARTRLELFSTELQEELTRLLVAALGAVVVVVLGVLGIAFAALALILSLAEEQRGFASGMVALGFIVLAAAAAWGVRRLAHAKPRPFDASLTELERDYRAVRP